MTTKKKKATSRPKQPTAKSFSAATPAKAMKPMAAAIERLKPKPYTGLLAKPPPAVYPALFDPDNPPPWVKMRFRHYCEELSAREYLDLWRAFVLEAREKFLEKHDRRLDLLFQHYNIDRKTPDAWREIAMALAQTHVPAFQIEPAVRKYHKTKSNKPINLDVVGTAYFLIHDYLCEKEKEQPLTPFEKDLKESLDEELKALIANDSRRGLKRQMLSAWRDYWNGCANNFQRQFVEQVLPPTFDLFKKMDANRVTRTP